MDRVHPRHRLSIYGPAAAGQLLFVAKGNNGRREEPGLRSSSLEFEGALANDGHFHRSNKSHCPIIESSEFRRSVTSMHPG
jgi:hypothetical protein